MLLCDFQSGLDGKMWAQKKTTTAAVAITESGFLSATMEDFHRQRRQLQLCWIFQQFDHAFEEAAGAAAVDAAMVEAQRDLCFRLWNEFFLFFVP
jgi:hypothetical protein